MHNVSYKEIENEILGTRTAGKVWAEKCGWQAQGKTGQEQCLLIF